MANRVTIIMDADGTAFIEGVDKVTGAAGKAREGLDGVSASSGKVNKEFGKLTDASGYAASGLRRVRNVVEGMAFGVVVGAVSAVTEELIRHYKEAILTKEKVDDLSRSVDAQAEKWKLLPEPIHAASQEMVNVYNAQLKILKLQAPDEIKKLSDSIVKLKEDNDRLKESLQRMQAVPGLYNAAATIKAFSMQLARNEETVAKNEEALKKWRDRLKEMPATLAKIEGALGGEAARKAYEAVEQKITAVQVAIVKLNGDKTDLLTIEAQELVNLGATTRQLQAYLDLREEQIRLEEMASMGKTELLGVPDYDASEKAYKDRLKWQEEFDKELLQQKIAAMGELAALEAEEGRAPLKEAAANSEIARIYFEYDQKLLALQDYNTKKLGLMAAAGATEAQIEETYRQMNIEAADKEKVFKIQAAGQAFGAAANMMQNLFVATGKHNSAMFALGKAFAIAQTAIDTYQASMAAYKALSGIPIVGPALGAAAAAAIVATGLARVREIASMQPGGGSISSGGTANPSYSGGSPGAYPPVQRVEEADRKRPLEINLHVYGSVVDHDAFAREIVPSITKAINDGVR